MAEGKLAAGSKAYAGKKLPREKHLTRSESVETVKQVLGLRF